MNTCNRRTPTARSYLLPQTVTATARAHIFGRYIYKDWPTRPDFISLYAIIPWYKQMECHWTPHVFP